jgi:peptide/nickel transport system substrate-binding protein
MNEKARWRLGVLLALLLVALATLGASAGKSARQGTQRHAASSTLVDGTTDSVVNIDPAGSYDLGSQTVQYQIFQHLLEAGPGGLTPHPVLATKCAFKGNLKTFACSLRHGVKFHNGKTMTSADVKWSFDRVVKIKDPSGIYTLLANLKSVATKGKYGVVFHLKAPQATWPQHLTTGAADIVPKGFYPAAKIRSNTSAQVGTGPYQLVKFQPGQTAVFKKFKGYWGKPAKTSNVIIRYYSKSSTMKLALQRGDIDMAFPGAGFTPTELVSLRGAKGIKVHKGNGASIRYLVLNVKRDPTNKLAVRKALAYLIPRQTIAKRVYHGLVAPLYTMVAAGLPGHVNSFASVYGTTPSTAKARAVLKAAGISTPVNITLWYTPSHYGDSSADEYAEIQRAFQASGLFKVTLQSAEWATYSKTLGTQYGAFQLGWFPDYVDAENYLLPFYPSCKDCNFTGNNYKNAKMDSIMAKEQATKSLAKRLSLVKKAQAIAAKDVPIIPYWQAPIIAVSRTSVKGIDQTLDPTFIMRLYLVSKS